MVATPATSDSPATVKSCGTCPSFLSVGEAARYFRKSIGAPMCARFARPLAMPSASASVVGTMEKIGTACKSHGLPQPSEPTAYHTEVALPDPSRRTELDDFNPDKNLVKTCMQCANHIPEEVVEEATGWTASACAATGRLILGNRKMAEARNCEYRRVPFGGVVPLMLDLFLPAYMDTTVKMVSPVEAFLKGDTIPDPLDYPTDREVTEEESDRGIISWRRLIDPEGEGGEVYLPVFSPKIFSDEEKNLIPKNGDKERPEFYIDHNGAAYRIAVLWMELDETPAAWGEPGVGKTEVGRYLAWMMQVPFHRISIKESTEVAELEGAREFSPEEGTWFRDGRFVKAWQSICVMVIDEPNMGRPEVTAFLRPAFDNSKTIVIDSDGGRQAVRGDYCFPLLAMNPAWSPLHVGTNQLSAADASRLMHIFFDFPEPKVERRIISTRTTLDGWEIDNARLDMVMYISDIMRKLVREGTIQATWGIRENIKVSRALLFFSPISAYRMALADYLEIQQQQIVLDQVKANLGLVSLPKPKRLES